MQDPQPKKGKKGRRKRNDSDEDIEKVLAELELEYSGQKKEVKDEDQQPTDVDEDKSKKERKEQKKDKHETQSVNDDVNSLTEETDDKKKKGKKGRRKEKNDINDEVFNEEAHDIVEDDDDHDNKKKKGKKGKKKEKNDINDEVFNEEAHDIVEDDDDHDNKKKKGKKGKKKEKNDINDEVFNEEAHDIVEDDDDHDNKKKKGKKGKKKEKNDINDDIYNEEKHEIIQDNDNDDDDGEKIKDKEVNKKDKDELNDDMNHGEEDMLLEDDDQDDDDYKKKKKEKKDKKKDKSDITDENNDKSNDMDIEVSTVKTAAQKKKEKKEREKQKKMAQKKAEAMKKADNGEVVKEVPTTKEIENTSDEKKPSPEPDAEPTDPEEGKKKKKKGTEKETKEKGKGPGKKTIAAMQEALKKLKEEEERLKREEEERIREEELREQARLEQLRLEQERKEKKKLKEKQRKERLKAEGKLLTTKQKQDRARAQAMLEALKAQGLDVPGIGEKKTRPGTRIRPNKVKQQTSTEEKDETKKEQNESTTDTVQVEIVDQQLKEAEEKKEEEVKDSWDAESSGDEHAEDKSDDASKCTNKSKETIVHEVQKGGKKEKIEDTKNESSESESESESGSESESEDESEDDSGMEDKVSDATRKKERARERIQNRRIEAEKKKSLDNLRAAVVCVLGHVDTGKTKILDKLRRTNVQDSEAGGITQQIGATNVPIDAIQESTKHVKGFADKKFKIPGLLIIDTPGHESFSNLRNRGSSLCDIAVLVVDIMHGLEPQTIESINLLKAKKCPFVVALNKIDRLYDWQTMNRKDVQDIVKGQAINTQREFEKRSKEVIVQFAEQSLNAALFYENPDPRSYVSLVPTSAITGEGMGNLLALIVDACQGPLAKRLMFSEELQATVLEVKALPGLGTTIDCILVNGILREGDSMIVAGTDGPIVTQIRSLLMPQPLKELRVKNAYIEHREVKAAQGVKIAAKDLEKAIAGLNLQVAQKPDEVEVLKEEIAKELSSVLGNIRLADRGVYVQASTLGALEALLDFLKSSKIPYAGIRIGPVVKKDVMKASIMLEHDSQYATILAFDVKIERDAQELADSLGVKIFQADIIYHLFDKFTSYREELKQRKRDEHKHIAVFPCKLRVLPQYIFNSRDPIVMGVMVEAGIVKEGTPLCVPSKDFVELGLVTSIEYNHKSVETARKGQEVCIKIEPIPGEAPKMFGRHFDEKDFIISKISRQSIDACKEYFRDDLMKTDWQLMVELKKLFQIL